MRFIMRWPSRTVHALALGAGAALILQGLALPAPAQPPPAQTAADTQTVTVTLARGIKDTSSIFGSGLVTPVDPTTSFVDTDLPYAIVKVKPLPPDADVTLRLADPGGPAYTINARIPSHRGNPKEFDVALPMYILGTDLEDRFGTWHLDVTFNGQPRGDTAFQWGPASPIQLSKIKDLVDQNPMSADLHWRYGAALALLHHDQEAIRELQGAIQLDRNYALYYITLGRVYEREGRTADAMRSFQTALALHGSYYDTVYSGWAKAHLTRLQAR
ncbi:MAG TPA: hypothetical protein VJT32_05020 [bacterium]|nr:hypothetical protein [bacterium]